MTGTAAPPLAVLTDLNGILLEPFWPSAAAALAEAMGEDATQVGRELARRARPFEIGIDTLDGLHRELGQAFSTIPALLEFRRIVLEGAVRPIGPNVELLRAVRTARHVRCLAVAQFGREVYEAVARRLPMRELFDDLLISFDFGITKPDPQVFIEAVARSRVRPPEALYLDPVEEHASAARTIGLIGVRVPTPQSLPTILHRYFPGAG